MKLLAIKAPVYKQRLLFFAPDKLCAAVSVAGSFRPSGPLRKHFAFDEDTSVAALGNSRG